MASYLIAIIVAVLVPLLGGCQQDSAQNQINDQYAADFQAKKQELQPMVGYFDGKVHLLQLDQDFEAQLVLYVPPETEHSPQSEDPSETVQIAMLKGSMQFPAVVNLPLEDYSGYQALLNPLDGLANVTIVYGDYNPLVTPSVSLPYVAQDGKTEFGTFEGQISGDEFTGTWYADDFGNVGTFDLHRISKTPAVVGGGSTPEGNAPQGDLPGGDLR